MLLLAYAWDNILAKKSGPVASENPTQFSNNKHNQKIVAKWKKKI